MNLCSEQHEEVCFEGRKCPACEAITEREGVEGELERMKVLLESTNEVVEELRGDIEDLKNATPENQGSPAN